MRRVFPLLLLLALLLAGCQGEAAPAVSYDLDQVPAYAGEPYVVINDNQPFFGEEEYTTEAFETYSALDGLGRCGTAYACVGEELMPAGERESISSVKPSGWINVEYGGQYLYNRCHLIGFQLTGENANERNLITGTRYMLNTNTKKFHLPTCASVEDMKPENRTDYTGSREALLDEGYSPCGQCKP